MAPKAPTKRKISCALHRAWAAVKIGISNTGVPTKRSRSRHRSRIQTEGLAAACAVDPPAPEVRGAVDGAGARVCVAILRLIIQKDRENKPALARGSSSFVMGKSKRR